VPMSLRDARRSFLRAVVAREAMATVTECAAPKLHPRAMAATPARMSAQPAHLSQPTASLK
jgi:hypothetical protein